MKQTGREVVDTVLSGRPLRGFQNKQHNQGLQSCHAVFLQGETHENIMND